MAIESKITETSIEITKNGDTLSIPRRKWGGPISYRGQEIPGGRVWDIVSTTMAEGKPLPVDRLIKEAARAEIYCYSPKKLVVWTETPRPGDKHIEGNLYMRNDNQRIRPLFTQLELRVARIEGGMEAEKIRETHKLFKDLGMDPVASGDDKIFYSQNAEAIFDQFGSRDWVRLYIILKRPGSSSIKLNLTQSAEAQI